MDPMTAAMVDVAQVILPAWPGFAIVTLGATMRIHGISSFSRLEHAVGSHHHINPSDMRQANMLGQFALATKHLGAMVIFIGIAVSGPTPGKWTRGFNQDAILSVAEPAASNPFGLR